MITIAVVNSKGGVGKTTLAAALAVCAAKEGKDKRVCMVDLDPQKSLVEWWKRRGKGAESPTIFQGVDSATEAVDRAAQSGWDWVFLDGPPAFLTVIEEMITAADLALIPVKPSVADLLSTEDAVVLARGAGTAFLCVFNDVGPKEKVVDVARQALFSNNVPIAETVLIHRVSHITGMNAGKSAAEVNRGKDTAAAAEIAALWQEVKAAAIKAAKARAKAVAHG
jgi:chromosome partitioning protein